MSPITTHVLDTSRGAPAQDIAVRLEIHEAGHWRQLAEGITNNDGRISNLLPKEHELAAGLYRITFDTGPYFLKQKVPFFYPYASIVFNIEQPKQHYHIPLLVSGFGYSTYRGS